MTGDIVSPFWGAHLSGVLHENKSEEERMAYSHSNSNVRQLRFVSVFVCLLQYIPHCKDCDSLSVSSRELIGLYIGQEQECFSATNVEARRRCSLPSYSRGSETNSTLLMIYNGSLQQSSLIKRN